VGTPYVGQIKLFAGNFAPVGWMFCQGQELSISEYDALYTLIGTTYGGDGDSTFALPNLSARLPVHMGTGSDGVNYVIAQSGGTETVTLQTSQLPTHTHPYIGTAALATTNDPTNNVPASSTGATVLPYGLDQPPTVLNPSSVSPVGQGGAHDNVQPFICINYIISLYGVFPSPY
jgi:microcystin-dependent protein